MMTSGKERSRVMFGSIECWAWCSSAPQVQNGRATKLWNSSLELCKSRLVVSSARCKQRTSLTTLEGRSSLSHLSSFGSDATARGKVSYSNGWKRPVYPTPIPYARTSAHAKMTYPDKAKICIVGAGAIGGLLGVELSRQGHSVTFLARGAHLAAMQRAQALKLVKLDGTTVSSGPGSAFVSSLEGLPLQDVVVLGLKMHQIAAVLPSLGHVVGPDTVMLATQNGIPWWYFQRYSGPEQWRERTVEAVDPGGVLKEGIDAAKVIATVVYPAARVSEPGVVTHVEGVRFPVGEPSGEKTERVVWLAGMLVGAGFKSPVLEDVRGELWLKLWGTVAVNPLSALTHATLDELCTVESGRGVVVRMMKEVEKVANELGTQMRVPLERRVNGAAKVGRHRTSMLQDCESGREMEVGTIMGAVVELARLCEVDIPCVDTVYGTVQMLSHVMKKEKAKVSLLPLHE